MTRFLHLIAQGLLSNRLDRSHFSGNGSTHSGYPLMIAGII
jgi:hypothetical protein